MAAQHVIQIDDMSCSRCVSAVTDALTNVPGVRVMGVAIGSAKIEADAPAAQAAVAALEQIGFPARLETPFSPKPTEPRTPDS